MQALLDSRATAPGLLHRATAPASVYWRRGHGAPSVQIAIIASIMKNRDPLATTGLPGLDPNSDGSAFEHDRPGESKYLILVVDDSADNVAMLSLYLQQQGYRVVTASNGEDAIKVASQTKPSMILMDISMPTLDGLAATRRIRDDEALREIPVIAVTAFGTEGFQRAAYDVGVSGYLVKPIDLDRMSQLIARLLSPGASGELTASPPEI